MIDATTAMTALDCRAQRGRSWRPKMGKRTGYELADVGSVDDGERQDIFEPENIVLPPPHE